MAEYNSALRKILYFDHMSWLADNLLELGGRMTMAFGLEGRMPFIDHELIELVPALPDEDRLRKKILHDVMKRFLSPAIIDRPNVEFRVPINE